MSKSGRMHLLPGFCMPVKPGPNTDSSAFPGSFVREKSKLRLSSICLFFVITSATHLELVVTTQEGTHQLGHGLFHSFLRLHVDAKVGQVQGELSADALFVARVAIYVWPPLSADPDQKQRGDGCWGSPALPSEVMAPNLAHTGCVLSSRCASAWPFPPTPA